MLDVLAPFYPWIKALHIVSMVSWMAGLFYLPRIFVYHTERGAEPGVSEVFKVMERKLFRFIMRPAMMATWGFGILLVLTPGIVSHWDIWFWVKLVCVIGMTGFHEWCGKQVKIFAEDANTRDGRHFRLMNEVPTVLLLVIVGMVVIKPF